MQHKLKLLFLSLSLLFILGSASEQAHVTQLTGSDFEEKTADGKVYFIKFFAPWCGHCKRLAPTWGELGEALKDNGDIVIASVDCTQHRSICDSADIKGFPTLQIHYGGQAKAMYKGARTINDLKAFVVEQRRLLLDETTA